MTITTAGTHLSILRSFGLQENPFGISPDDRFLFLNRAYQSALSELMFGIEARRGLLVLTGEPGTGKTLLIRHLLQWLNRRNQATCYVFHAHLDTTGIFELMAQDFGARLISQRKSDLEAELQIWLRVRQASGDSPVAIIDEAQALSVRTLNELGSLLNLESPRGKLLQIVLAGQPELDEKLRQPELREFGQRVAASCRLPLLRLGEIKEYVAAHVRIAGGTEEIFSPDSVQALCGYAQGVPRVVNLLCEKALVAAFVRGGATVTAVDVRHAAEELDFALEPGAVSAPDISLETDLVIPLGDSEVSGPHEAPAHQDVRQVTEALLELPEPATTPREETTVAAEIPAVPREAFFTLAERPAETAEEPPPAGRSRESRLQRYCCEVRDSFARDWADFVSGGGPSLRRDVIEPVSRWLNGPIIRKGPHPMNSDHSAGQDHS